MKEQEFTSYIVADGKLRPKLPVLPTRANISQEDWSAFEAFASQHEFPIVNPEALNGRTELKRDEVELICLTDESGEWNQKAYLIKEGKEVCLNCKGEKLVWCSRCQGSGLDQSPTPKSLQEGKTLAEVKDEVARKHGEPTWDKLNVYIHDKYLMQKHMTEVVELYVSQFKQRGDEWVSVKNLLPSFDHTVLVHVEYLRKGNLVQDTFVGYMDEYGDLISLPDDDNYGWQFNECVTHWRELPKPPKAGLDKY